MGTKRRISGLGPGESLPCQLRTILDRAVLPRFRFCPGCRTPMVLVEKRHILFSDGRAEITYRCETCGTETKRMIKDR